MTPETQPFLQDLQARLIELLRASPAADVERNVKALIGQAFQRFELVTRDELDACADLLAALGARVARLEDTVAALERAATAGPVRVPPDDGAPPPA